MAIVYCEHVAGDCDVLLAYVSVQQDLRMLFQKIENQWSSPRPQGWRSGDLTTVNDDGEVIRLNNNIVHFLHHIS